MQSSTGDKHMNESLRMFMITTRYFVKSYLYSKRFYVSLLIPLVVLLVISIANIAYSALKTVNDYLSVAISFFVGLFYSIIFALIAGDLVAEDFEKDKAYFIFTLPLQRKLIYFSKITANILIVFTIVSLYNIVAAFFSLAYYRSLPASLILSYAMQIVYAIAWLFLSATIGSISRDSKNAIKITVLTNFFILNTLGSVIAKAGVSQPWFILNYVYYPIYTILLPSSQSSITIGTSIGAVTIQIPTIECLLLVSFAYIMTGFIICYFLYTRREVR